MILTTEVRWFFEGELPGDVESWFGDDTEYASRTDAYLMFPNSSNAGVKLREGQFQIKTFCDLAEVKNNFSGVYEHWEKWSQPVGENPFGRNKLEGEWIDIQKTRSTQIYKVIDHMVEKVTDTKMLDQACQFELCKVYCQGKMYHSLAFEAWGGSSQQQAKRLSQVVDHVLGSCVTKTSLKESSFSPINSLSYPAWLRSLQE